MSVLKVSELTNYISKYLKLDYFINDLSVEGEVSNYNRHSSGNLFFSLKDDNSKIDCFMSVVDTSEIELFPEEGERLIITGAVTFSEKTSKIIFVVRSFELSGEGSLLRRFTLLKEKLDKEGLFDPIHKKQIPKFPNRIGVVTSPTGAAITDILNVMKRRNKNIDIIIYPSLVQGEGAAETIIDGLQTLDKMKLDCIILARGGGSKEDLFVFNDENIARTIFKLSTPIISAVGHEIDFSISDYVADLRAPTPSAAAELVSCKLSDMIENIFDLKKRMDVSISNKLILRDTKLQRLRYGLNSHSPTLLINENKHKLSLYRDRITWSTRDRITSNRLKVIKLKNFKDRLIAENINRHKIKLKNYRFISASLQNNLYYKKTRLIYNKNRLDKYILLEIKKANQNNKVLYNEISLRDLYFKLKHLRIDINSIESKIKSNIDSILQNNMLKLNILKSKLDMEYRKNFGIYKEGKLIKSVNDVEVGSTIKSLLEDGILNLEVTSIEKVRK